VIGVRRRWALLVAPVALVGAFAACSDDGNGSSSTTDATGGDGGNLTLTSSAFDDGGDIPDEFSCNGDDVSPPLSWSGGSPMAIGYALIMEDLDANDFVHWVLFDIPGDTTSLAAGEDGGGTVGTNQIGTQRYLGPCPPSGNHAYVFTLWELFEPLDLGPEATAEDVKAAVENAPSTTLSGFYARTGATDDAES
jgi:Raf kinase inhibitor-like YbhB/YbcL family protein